MDLNINKEMETNKVTDRILQAIIENCYRPRYLSKNQKHLSDYLDEFIEKFQRILSVTGKENFDTLLSIQNDIS